jgi:hypothetical protein
VEKVSARGHEAPLLRASDLTVHLRSQETAEKA